MELAKYEVFYQYDPEPGSRLKYLVQATSHRAAIDHFYDLHNPDFYTAIGTHRLRDKREEKKVDLTKKITVTLTEDDIKEIVAEYVKEHTCISGVTAENVELVYGVKYSGPQMDRVEHGYLKECKVKC